MNNFDSLVILWKQLLPFENELDGITYVCRTWDQSDVGMIESMKSRIETLDAIVYTINASIELLSDNEEIREESKQMALQYLE